MADRVDLGVPLYTVVRRGNRVYAAGGGGGSATGVGNSLVETRIHRGRVEVLSTIDTHPHAVMTLDLSPGAGILLAGLEENVGVYAISSGAASFSSTSSSSSSSTSRSSSGPPGLTIQPELRGTWQADMDRKEPRVRKIVASHTPGLVATTGSDARIRVWRVGGGGGEPSRVHTLTGHTGVVRDLAFNLHATQIASVSSADGTLKIWNVVQGALIRSIAVASVASAVATNLSLTSSSSTPASPPGGKSRLSFRAVYYSRSAAHTPYLILGLTGKLAGESEPSTHLVALNPETGAVLATHRVANQAMTAMAYSDDGSLVAAATDQAVYVVRIGPSPNNPNRPIMAPHATLNPHPLLVTAIAFSGNNEYLISVSVDRTLALTRITSSSRNLFLIIAAGLLLALAYWYFLTLS